LGAEEVVRCKSIGTLQDLFDVACSAPSRGLLLCITAKIVTGHRIDDIQGIDSFLKRNIKYYGKWSIEAVVSNNALAFLAMSVDRRVSVRLFRSAHSSLSLLGMNDFPGIAQLSLMEATALYSLGRDRECF